MYSYIDVHECVHAHARAHTHTHACTRAHTHTHRVFRNERVCLRSVRRRLIAWEYALRRRKFSVLSPRLGGGGLAIPRGSCRFLFISARIVGDSQETIITLNDGRRGTVQSKGTIRG